MFILMSTLAGLVRTDECADMNVSEVLTRAGHGPFVVANEKTLEGVRSKVKTDGRARAWWNVFRRAADELLHRPVIVPPRGAAFEQGMCVQIAL